MSTLSLIPFGLRLDNNQFVDVSNVQRGGECNCICPSCKTPLIARQGEINEWHFAHASKGVFSDTEKECKYSFWLSVTLMAKQIIQSANSIQLPPLIMYTSEAFEIKVSGQKKVIIDEIEIEKKVNSVPVDAMLRIDKYFIAVVFTSPHSHRDNNTSSITSNGKVGVLEISLENAVQWLFGSNHQGKYIEVLKSNILENNNCKRWLYHPRKSVIEHQNNISLNETCPVKSHQQGQAQHYVKEKKYKCIRCDNRWFGTHKCSSCNTHLYSIELEDTF